MTTSSWQAGLLACALICMTCASCTAPADKGDAGGGAVAEDDSTADCPPASLHPDGTCCPTGRFFDPEPGACIAVGPADCAGDLPGSLQSCQPRWCWRWLDAGGKPCQAMSVGCMPSPRACEADEPQPGCPPGQWPAAPGNACVLGGVSAPGGEASSDVHTSDVATSKTPPPPGPPIQPPGVPALATLPALMQTRFCIENDATANCPAANPGCGDGKMPSVGASAPCMDVGVPWACPPGFAEHAAGTPPGSLIVACKPDPKACGAGIWPTLPPKAEVFHVDGNAKPGGNGTIKAPLSTIQAAIALASEGAVVAIAPGNYVENLTIDKALSLIGTCPAKVKIVAAVGGAVVTLHGKGKGEVVIAGVQMTGPAAGVINNGSRPVHLERVWIHGTTGFGIWAQNAVVKVTDALIEAVDALPGGEAGIGLFLRGGAETEVLRVRVRQARTAGVFVRDAGTYLEATSLLVDSTRARKTDDLFGYGIVLTEGATGTLRSSRSHGNRGSGVHLSVNSKVAATGLLVDGTLAMVDGRWGFGMIVAEGCTATLRGVRLSGNRTRGLDVSGTGSTLDARGLIIDGTREQVSDGALGTGLYTAPAAPPPRARSAPACWWPTAPWPGYGAAG